MADIIKDDITNQIVVCPIVTTSYALVTSTITPTSIYWRINNGSDVDLVAAGATLTYSANLGGQILSIPYAAITATGRYCLCIKSTGNENYNLDGLIVLPQSTFATAASITAIQGSGWTTQTMVAIKTAVDGISITGGSSAEQVISSEYFSYDASAKTITLTSPYNTITAEQIISIFNASRGTWLYNTWTRQHGAQPGKPWTEYHPLDSVTNGVIIYTAPNPAGSADTDIIQILVNKV